MDLQLFVKFFLQPDRVSPDLCTPLAIILCATYEKASLSACLKCMKLLVKVVPNLLSLYIDQWRES